jgi:Xaa-Pro aminopeptidase
MRTSIAPEEFAERVRALQRRMRQEGFQIVITFGDEAEPQYVRYFSDYWPSFETAGVLIPADGEATLLIGPESYTYAAAWSKLSNIKRLLEYRESSEPEYPGEVLSTFGELFRQALAGRSGGRIGVVGYPLMPTPVYESIMRAAGQLGCSVERAERLVIDMKQVKSDAEIEIMRSAASISERALLEVVKLIQPGMTEIEVVGEAHRLIRQMGAEAEAYPMWCTAGPNTTQAIARPTHRRIRKNELVQVQVGARLGGYASSVGRPLVFGDAPEDIRDFIRVGLEAHRKVIEGMRAGIPAREVDTIYRTFLRERNAESYILYGPCHGTGLMEGEHPWIEKSSDFLLQANMTFCVDNFLRTDQYGLRWEDVVRVTSDGVEELTSKLQDVLII